MGREKPTLIKRICAVTKIFLGLRGHEDRSAVKVRVKLVRPAILKIIM